MKTMKSLPKSFGSVYAMTARGRTTVSQPRMSPLEVMANSKIRNDKRKIRNTPDDDIMSPQNRKFGQSNLKTTPTEGACEKTLYSCARCSSSSSIEATLPHLTRKMLRNRDKNKIKVVTKEKEKERHDRKLGVRNSFT